MARGRATNRSSIYSLFAPMEYKYSAGQQCGTEQFAGLKTLSINLITEKHERAMLQDLQASAWDALQAQHHLQWEWTYNMKDEDSKASCHDHSDAKDLDANQRDIKDEPVPYLSLQGIYHASPLFSRRPPCNYCGAQVRPGIPWPEHLRYDCPCPPRGKLW